jgi:hypothetical protein
MSIQISIIVFHGSYLNFPTNAYFRSHGTLAFLVALELKLIRIKPYIRLQYIPVRAVGATVDSYTPRSLKPKKNFEIFSKMTLFRVILYGESIAHIF